MSVHEPLVRFIGTLRTAGVRISVAEGLDAMATAEVVGYSDRQTLKDALGLTLAKSLEEKVLFEDCFDNYFRRDEFRPSSESESGKQEGGEEAESELGQMMLDGDGAALAQAMEAAANQVGISQIRIFTQVNLYARRIMEQMGLDRLEGEIAAQRRLGTPAGTQQADILDQAREDLREQVRNFVARQLDVFARGETDRLRDSFLRDMRLGNLGPRDKARMRVIVKQIARRLATRHARVLKKKRKGQLDVRRTIRKNLPNDGVLFRTAFRFKKIDRPKIIAICDVSGSVAASAEFLLLFLWSLREVLAGVRAYAFSSDIADVTDILTRQDEEEATKTILRTIGGGSTNYGRSLDTFRKNWMSAVDRKTTVIILGDGRGNRTEPRADIVRELSERAKRLIWLNPEPKPVWGSGDSDMPRYRPYCHLAKVTNSVKHLEEVVSDLLEADRHG